MFLKNPTPKVTITAGAAFAMATVVWVSQQASAAPTVPLLPTTTTPTTTATSPSEPTTTAIASSTSTSTSTATPTPSPTSTTTAPKWIRTFRDDFNGTTVDKTKWGVYQGTSKLNAHPENVTVKNGYLNLATTKVSGEWRGGGVSNARSFHQTYGKYEMRARLDPAKGTRGVSLLWPTGGGWPPEIDWFEIGGKNATRQGYLATNHYGAENNMDHLKIPGDFTQWRLIRLEWSPQLLAFYIDNKFVGKLTGPNIPSRDMWMGLQTNVAQLATEQPDATTPAVVNFQIDWIAAYARAS